MANIEQLDPLLQSLQALKPPGASKGKITAITNLCVENVQSESVITQRLYRHLKRTPGTHKLGVLYVVDSVTRQWIEKARSSGQDLTGGAATDGSFASGVHKITELLPSLVDDLIQNAPSDHKTKLENLVQIWERGSTFPLPVLADIKKKLSEPAPQYVPSTTPPGSPPLGLLVSLGLRQPPKPQQVVNGAPPPQPQAQSDASSILAALSRLQPMPAASAPLPPLPMAVAPQQAPAADLAAFFGGSGQPYQAPNMQAPPPLPFNGAPQSYGQSYGAPTPIQGMSHGYPPQFQPPPPPQPAPPQQAGPESVLPPHIINNPQILPHVLQLLQGLAQEGIPQNQWSAVLSALYPPPAPQQTAPAQEQYPSRSDDYPRYRDRSRDRGRNRSRSPDAGRNNSNNSGRRGSPVYGVYDATAANSVNDHAPHFSDRRGRGGRGGGRSYRQRSPPTIRPPQIDNTAVPHGINPKWTEVDPNVPAGHIKVLSRTLFVGGATGSEAELRAIFGRWGQVQTCIANEDKRHAFVKMCTRTDALTAKSAMETMRDQEVLAKARQTKWGVGFGPRECCDYATGVSIIPIDTLTDADHKWMLTAEFGGTGGRPIESGLVVEEPDIEIGAGVSSKAMSRRVGPDGGGRRGGRGGGNAGGSGRFRQSEAAVRPDPVTIDPPPPVPGFGFLNIPGMPQFR